MVLVFQILLMIISALLVVLVLLHKGKGGGLSDMFGGGISSSFGGSSAAERNLYSVLFKMFLHGPRLLGIKRRHHLIKHFDDSNGKPRCARFSAISNPMKPAPTMTALSAFFSLIHARIFRLSGIVRRTKISGESTPGRGGRKAAAPGESTRAS